MEDVLFVAGTGAFFALALAYVRFCDRIIGPDPVDATPTPVGGVDGREPIEVGR